jgi:hypothetical protein
VVSTAWWGLVNAATLDGRGKPFSKMYSLTEEERLSVEVAMPEEA